VRVVNSIIGDAVRRGASDLHLEPGQLRMLPYYTSISVVRALGDRRMIELDAGDIAQAQYRRPSNRAALRLEMAAARRHQAEGECFAALAK